MFNIFRRVEIPLTVRDWFSFPDRVTELRSIISNKTYLTAIATLKESRRPTVNAVGLDDAANSKASCYYAGYCDALDDIAKLSQNNPQFSKPNTELKSWDVNIPNQ